MYGTTDERVTITGMAGVVELGDPAGTITVQPPMGGTVVEVTASVGDTEATVYLDRDAATRLILAVAVASREL